MHAIGTILLLTALASSCVLLVSELSGVSVPGCGPLSDCSRLASGPWGRIPELNWPFSFVGFAYFDAMTLAWIASRGGLDPLLRNIARLGALASIGFVTLMLGLNAWCPYCAVVHVANLGFLVVSELTPPRSPPSPHRPALLFAISALSVTAFLIPIKIVVRNRAIQSAETALSQSITNLVTGASASDVTTTFPAMTESAPTAVVPTSTSSSGLSGRWRTGPDPAAIRLVIFSDYQCVDCKRIEGEIRELLSSRSDISLTARHFPMCTDCNRHMAGTNMHRNACWAARAAEAAGIIAGPDGFWRMHRWLFDRAGAFTDAELNAALDELGFPQSEFIRVMTGEETLRRVQADIEAAISLGLHFTPMIFINGVEIRGWNALNGVRRAVDALVATNPAPASVTDDRPPLAAEKYIEDWRLQPPRPMHDSRDWADGPDDANVRVVVFGDYSEPNTAALDALIRAFVRGEPFIAGATVRYHFRHYPFNQDCNPSLSQTRFPHSCLAARIAEAAGTLAGNDAFWRAHHWLLTHQSTLGDASPAAVAAEIGTDESALRDAMSLPDVAAAIAEDVEAGKRASIRAIPTLFINGKWVPRWRLENQRVLERIIEQAALSP